MAASLSLAGPGIGALVCSDGLACRGLFWVGWDGPALSSPSELLLLATLCLLLRGLATVDTASPWDTLVLASQTSGVPGQGLEGGEVSGSNRWLLGRVCGAWELWGAAERAISCETVPGT